MFGVPAPTPINTAQPLSWDMPNRAGFHDEHLDQRHKSLSPFWGAGFLSCLAMQEVSSVTRSGRSKLFVVLMALLSLFCGYLSYWQWERLSWKESLLAEFAMAAELPAEQLTPETSVPAFVKVVGAPQRIWQQIQTKDRAQGFRLITLLKLDDNREILTDLGFVNQDDAASLMANMPKQLSGIALLRRDDEPSIFTPPIDEKEGLVFARHAASLGGVEGVMLEWLAEAEEPMTLRRDRAQVLAGIPNNHLQYALTWLALMLVGLVCTLIWWRRAGDDQQAEA